MANSARITTNLLEYIPNKAALSEEAWNASPVLMIYKLHKNLQLAAKMYPVIDPRTSAKYMADWTLVENFEARSAMSTYPGGQRRRAQEYERPAAHLHHQAPHSLLGKHREGSERAGV